MIEAEERAGPPAPAARRSRLDVRTIAEASLLLDGLLYLLPPFVIGLLVLRINVVTTLHAVQNGARDFLNGLGHFHLLSVPVGPALVSFLSSFPAGHAVLDGLHGVAFTLLLHP